MSWFKVNTNEVLCIGLTNAEIGIWVRYKALCEHFGVSQLEWQKIEFNFDCKERKVVSKLFGISPEVDPKLVGSESEVDPKLTRSSPEVSPKLVRSKSEVSLKNDNKNKDLAQKDQYNIYNIYNNNSIQDKTVIDSVPLCFVKQAERLADMVRKRKNVKIGDRKIIAWAKSLSLLEKMDGISVERIDKVLDWYGDHYGEDFVPVAESGQTLREKFLRLETAMAKSGPAEKRYSANDADNEKWKKLFAKGD